MAEAKKPEKKEAPFVTIWEQPGTKQIMLKSGGGATMPGVLWLIVFGLWGFLQSQTGKTEVREPEAPEDSKPS